MRVFQVLHLNDPQQPGKVITPTSSFTAVAVWSTGNTYELTFPTTNNDNEKHYASPAIYREGDTWYTDDRDDKNNLTLTTAYPSQIQIPTRKVTIKYDVNSPSVQLLHIHITSNSLIITTALIRE